MKTKNLLAIGIVILSAVGGFLYWKSKNKTTTSAPSSTGDTPAPSGIPEVLLPKPKPVATPKPTSTLPLSELDAQIAALPSNTTIAQLQPLLQQQQIANVQAEIDKQHQADDLAHTIFLGTSSKNFFCSPRSPWDPTIVNKQMCEIQKDTLQTNLDKLKALGYYYQDGKAIKL